ncbi:hypothetical protein [Bartonella sp. B39]
MSEVEHDKNGNVLYKIDENGSLIEDSHGQKISLYHDLKAEDEQHLQAGSDGNIRVFYNGIFNTQDEATHNAVQLADNEHDSLYFMYFPKADSWEIELGIVIYQYVGEGSNSTEKF